MDNVLQEFWRSASFGERLCDLRTFSHHVSVHTMVHRLALLNYDILPREYEDIEDGKQLPSDIRRFLGAVVLALGLTEDQKRSLVVAITLDMLLAAFTSLADDQVADQLVDVAVQLLNRADLHD